MAIDDLDPNENLSPEEKSKRERQEQIRQNRIRGQQKRRERERQEKALKEGGLLSDAQTDDVVEEEEEKSISISPTLETGPNRQEKSILSQLAEKTREMKERIPNFKSLISPTTSQESIPEELIRSDEPTIRKFGPVVKQGLFSRIVKRDRGLEEAVVQAEEDIKEGMFKVRAGGRFTAAELPVAGQVFGRFKAAEEDIMQQQHRAERALKRRERREINREIKKITPEGKEPDSDAVERVKQTVQEKYAPQFQQIQEKYAPVLKEQRRLMERSQPVGLQIDPKSLERVEASEGVAGQVGRAVGGFTGAAKDITVQTLQEDYIKTRMRMAHEEQATGERTIRRGQLSPMMQQVLRKVEKESGTTLERDQEEIQERLLDRTKKFIDANKESADQVEKFTREFGKMDKSFKGGTASQQRFMRAMSGVQDSFVSISRISTGIVSSIGALSRGDFAGMFSGTTTFLLGLGRLARTMSRGGRMVGGMFRAGGVGRWIGGALGVAGGLVGGAAGAMLGLGALGIGAQQRQFREAAQYEQAAHRMMLMQGEVPIRGEGVSQIPVSQIQEMSGRAMGAGLTLPQYQQVAIQAAGTALLTPQQQRGMMMQGTERGTTPVAEIARFAQAFGRPVQELTAQVGTIARATGANFQNIMETMGRVGDVGGMRGSLFTGEIQRAFGQISQSLMQSLGGIRGVVRQGATEQLIRPMMAAGVTPQQAAGVAGTMQNFVIQSIFNPQRRLLLESLGISRGSIERGQGAGGITAAEEFMRGIGTSNADLQQAGATGALPEGIQRVKNITGQQDTERAFTVLTRYIMGLSAGMANTIIETAKNVEAAADLRKKLKSLEEGSEEYEKTQAELSKVTGEATKGQEKYRDIISGQEFLLSFKEKVISITGSIATAMQGFLGREDIAKIMQDIQNAFQPILGLAADGIKPALQTVRDIIIKFGVYAEEFREGIAGISLDGITEKLASGELFETLGSTVSQGISKIMSDAASETMRLTKNAFVQKHPIIANILGVEADHTPEETRQLFKNEFVQTFGDSTIPEASRESENLTRGKEAGIERARGIQDKINVIDRAIHEDNSHFSNVTRSQLVDQISEMSDEELPPKLKEKLLNASEGWNPTKALERMKSIFEQQLKIEEDNLSKIMRKKLAYDLYIKILEEDNLEAEKQQKKKARFQAATEKANQKIQQVRQEDQELEEKLSQKTKTAAQSAAQEVSSQKKINTSSLWEEYNSVNPAVKSAIYNAKTNGVKPTGEMETTMSVLDPKKVEDSPTTLPFADMSNVIQQVNQDSVLMQNFGDLFSGISVNKQASIGAPTGETKDVTQQTKPISIFANFNFNGQKIGSQNMVVNDGTSFSSTKDLNDLSFFGR